MCSDAHVKCICRHVCATITGLGGALAGAGGGLCQVSIMSPCTYLVTGAVTGNKDESTMHRIKRTYAARGIKVLFLLESHLHVDKLPDTSSYMHWLSTSCKIVYSSLLLCLSPNDYSST